MQVGSLRAGRFYAVRLSARACAELDSGPVLFSDTFTSDVVAFRTLPCMPGQMQAPALARRDRTLLKVRWCHSCEPSQLPYRPAQPGPSTRPASQPAAVT